MEGEAFFPSIFMINSRVNNHLEQITFFLHRWSLVEGRTNFHGQCISVFFLSLSRRVNKIHSKFSFRKHRFHHQGWTVAREKHRHKANLQTQPDEKRKCSLKVKWNRILNEDYCEKFSRARALQSSRLSIAKQLKFLNFFFFSSNVNNNTPHETHVQL